MLITKSEKGNDRHGHKLVEVECSWCFGREVIRASNAARDNSCGCRKRGTSYVLAHRRKNLWSKYENSKMGPQQIVKEILAR